MEQQQQKKRGIVRRAAVGAGKAWAYSLGFTSLIRTGIRLGGRLVEAGGYVLRKLKDSPANYRHEAFEEAVSRLSLDEARLVRQARAFNTGALSWLAAMVMVTAWLGWHALSGTLTLQAFVLCLGLMFVTGAKSITWRFRFCQIRDQELYSFVPWFWSLGGRW